jgi:hypothetical protein
LGRLDRFTSVADAVDAVVGSPWAHTRGDPSGGSVR